MTQELPLLIALLSLTGAAAGWLLYQGRQTAVHDAARLEREMQGRAAAHGYAVTRSGRGFLLTDASAGPAQAQALEVYPDVFTAGAQMRAGIVDVWRVRIDVSGVPSSLSDHLVGPPLIANDQPSRDLQGQPLHRLLNATANTDGEVGTMLRNVAVRPAAEALFALRPVRALNVDKGVVEVLLERDTKSGREAWQSMKAAERLAVAIAGSLAPALTDGTPDARRPHPQSGQPVSAMEGVSVGSSSS